MTHVNLDIEGLNIKRVTNERGLDLAFKIESPNPEQGDLLRITLQDAATIGQQKVLTIEYETTDE